MLLVKAAGSSVDPKKRSLRSNTVIDQEKTSTTPSKDTPSKKREVKAKTKKEKKIANQENQSESPPTKGKDFSFLLKSKYKKKKAKGKTLAPKKKGLEAVAEEASVLEQDQKVDEE